MPPEIDINTLIDLVKERECIWNRDCDSNKDPAVRAKAWNQIAQIINPQFSKLDATKKADVAGGAIAQSSSAQRAVSQSTIEAEYKSLSEASKEAIHLKNLMNELTNKDDSDADNQQKIRQIMKEQNIDV